MIDKQSLRKQIQIDLKKNTPSLLTNASHQLCRHLETLPNLNASQNIAGYMAMAGEIDLFPFLKTLSSLGKTCFLPALSSDKATLLFFQYSPGDTLSLSPQGFYEPPKHRAIEPVDLDIVLVPSIAFDANYHRLGRGKGHYDKTFAFKTKQPTSKPYLIGIGFELQKVPILPVDPWDVRLDGIATEHSLYLR